MQLPCLVLAGRRNRRRGAGRWPMATRRFAGLLCLRAFCFGVLVVAAATEGTWAAAEASPEWDDTDAVSPSATYSAEELPLVAEGSLGAHALKNQETSEAELSAEYVDESFFSNAESRLSGRPAAASRALQAVATNQTGVFDNTWAYIDCGVDYTLGVTTVQTGLTWGFPFSERQKIYPPLGFLWRRFFAGVSHSCGIDKDGDTHCWGRNAEGQCNVPFGYNFVEITLGEQHTCAMTDLGRLFCWGTTVFNRLAFPGGPGKKWVQISAGSFSTCGVDNRGKILCWGDDKFNRLAVPYQNDTQVHWENVTCGNRHCCGLVTERSQKLKKIRYEDNALCWGSNDYGQLNVPVQAQGRVGVQERFQQIDAGHSHTCGLTMDNRVWCWGFVNRWGLVSGIPTGVNISYISSGGFHSCAILQPIRTGVCWGMNVYGQADVPKDYFTEAPSIMEYAYDPYDILPVGNNIKYSNHRWTRADASQARIYSLQFINMAFYNPEFARPGTTHLTFEIWDTSMPNLYSPVMYIPNDICSKIYGYMVPCVKDPYSPHVLTFRSPTFDIPGIHLANMSAIDLRFWPDLRFGKNPAIIQATSTVVNGQMHHGLVDGGVYKVTLSYEDALGHAPGTHTLERFQITYDLVTLAPIVRSPVPGKTKQALLLSYELLEDMKSDSVWVTFAFVGPGTNPPPGGVADPHSPHEIQLSPAAAKKGNYSFDINLLSTKSTVLPGLNPYVTRTLAAGLLVSTSSLVSGAFYTFTIRCMDMYNNAPQMVDVLGVEYYSDTATEPIIVNKPTRLVNPFQFEYIIPETADPLSVKIEFTWLQNKPGEPLAQIDRFSPHTFTVFPPDEVEQVVHRFNLSTTDLFKNFSANGLYDTAVHPRIRTAHSKGTPVISFLQPWSQYRINLSYMDKFQNPRTSTVMLFWTEFTAPSAPSSPEKVSSTVNSLTVKWMRGLTGGSRILRYMIQLCEAPDTNPNSCIGTETNRTVSGQRTNITTFIMLKSSRWYRVRLRASNVLGDSPWTPWVSMRTLSICGDGGTFDSEECDDGNIFNGDGCSSVCVVEPGWKCSSPTNYTPMTCSAAGMDGLRVGAEECDDCNTASGDGCSPQGTVEPFYKCIYRGLAGQAVTCHDGRIVYTADSCIVRCGDGLKHFSEPCDDGNLLNGDGCNGTCSLEPGFQCTYGFPILLTSQCDGICGDGLIRGTEECDDANTVIGDGCSNCKIDAGWVCIRVPSVISTPYGSTTHVDSCKQTCYNGVLDPGEECDDGNIEDNDGCKNCRLQPGFLCKNVTHRQYALSPSTVCTPICGDGYRIPVGPFTEACDDKNGLSGDGCSGHCQIELGFTCQQPVLNGVIQADVCSAICGDGRVRGSETCDDLNTLRHDGCSHTCQTEPGYICFPPTGGNPSECFALCGDGILTSPETCDDGNTRPNDGCNHVCRVEAGYYCSAVNPQLPSHCIPICGDSLVQFPETCDDGNVASGDGCTAVCQIEAGWLCPGPGQSCHSLCGDYERMFFEDCDDGNLISGDGCDSGCHVEAGWTCASYVYSLSNTTSVCSVTCGDGIRFASEQCDDGNLVIGDGCNSACQIEAAYTCCDTQFGRSLCTEDPQKLLVCGGTPCGDGVRQGVRQVYTCATSISPDCQSEYTSAMANNLMDAFCNRCANEPGITALRNRCSLCCSQCSITYMQVAEACDDGNLQRVDGCNEFCQVEQGYQCSKLLDAMPDVCTGVCGDGLQVGTEQCDDGNLVSGDGCDVNCLVEAGYQCKKGTSRSYCMGICGDGRKVKQESCDDGNLINFDGCNRNCEVEAGFTCSGGSLITADVCVTVCRDGIPIGASYSIYVPATSIEGCDTGTVFDEGCDYPTCKVKPGYTCAWNVRLNRVACSPICGDGIVSSSESCDDGNLLAGDGCSPKCEVETFWTCNKTGFGSICTSRCGDGYVYGSEQCDDGNQFSGDGCAANCTVEPRYMCTGGSTVKASSCVGICGDGFEVYGEDCDDNNTVSFDGCSLRCETEAGYFCTRTQPGSPSICSATCGDGQVTGSEECDSTLGCVHCRLSPGLQCGDSIRSTFTNETCDDGNLIDGDGCSKTCQVEMGWTCKLIPYYVNSSSGENCSTVCGDGLVIPGIEKCDDGNTVYGDGCSPTCSVEQFHVCFNNVETSLQAATGNKSFCVNTFPPMMTSAIFDSTFARISVDFDMDVAPLGSAVVSGGNAVVSFSCTDLFSTTTVGLLGTAPNCWWTTRRLVTIALGSQPTAVPGSAIEVISGTVRKYTFTSDFAYLHSVKIGTVTGSTVQPEAVVNGPMVVPTCYLLTTLDSVFSSGHGGRSWTSMRWSADGVFSTITRKPDVNESNRFTGIVNLMYLDDTVVFPRQGYIFSKMDLQYNRVLRKDFIYRVKLQVINFLGSKDTYVHPLYVTAAPVPVVTPAMGNSVFYTTSSRTATLVGMYVLPPNCYTAAQGAMTTFTTTTTSIGHISYKVQGVAAVSWQGWSYDPTVALVNASLYYSTALPNQISFPPSSLSAGRHSIVVSSCIGLEVTIAVNNTAPSSGLAVFGVQITTTTTTALMCGNYTLNLYVDFTPPALVYNPPNYVRRLIATPISSLIQSLTLQLTSFSYGDDLYGVPPEARPIGPLLGVMHNPSLSTSFVASGYRTWGVPLDANTTTVLGVIVMPPSTATAWDMRMLAWYRPRVMWTVIGATAGAPLVNVTPQMGVEVVSGNFLRIPKEQISAGTTIKVSAEVVLEEPGSIACSSGLTRLSISQTTTVNKPPVAGLLTATTANLAPLLIYKLQQRNWVDEDYPIVYRFKFVDSTGRERPVNDWYFYPTGTAIFLPRSNESVSMFGIAKDGLGSAAITNPFVVNFGTAYQDIFMLSEYVEGKTSLTLYTNNSVTLLLNAALTAASGYGTAGRLQVLDDVIPRALGKRRNDLVVTNCSTDCGQHGTCPPPTYVVIVQSSTSAPTGASGATGSNQNLSGSAGTGSKTIAVYNWTQCLCVSPWVGTRCERTQNEAAAQENLTIELSKLYNSTLRTSGLGLSKDVFAMVAENLLSLVDDCRRVPPQVTVRVSALILDVAKASSTNAISHSLNKIVALLTRLFECIPSDVQPTEPFTTMLAPQEVFDILGSSSPCTIMPGTQTSVCLELGSSTATVYCPNPASTSLYQLYTTTTSTTTSTNTTINASNSSSGGRRLESGKTRWRAQRRPRRLSAGVGQVSCRADLSLGIVHPYPCPCPINGTIFMGYGRPQNLYSLKDTLHVKEQYILFWRHVHELLVNGSIARPTSATTTTTTSQAAAASAQLARQREYQQSMQNIRKCAELASDAAVLAMVPGEAPKAAAAPMVSLVAAVSKVLVQGSGANSVAFTKVKLEAGTSIEMEFPPGVYPLAGGASNSTAAAVAASNQSANTATPAPQYEPFAGVIWKETGAFTGVFSWLDPSRTIRSDVLQLRTFRTLFTGSVAFSKLRYRFLVKKPTAPAVCVQAPEHIMRVCCPNLNFSLAVPPLSESCPAPAPPPTTTTITTTTTTTLTTTTTTTTASFNGYAATAQASNIPFDPPLDQLIPQVMVWVPDGVSMMLAGTRVRIRGGDIRIGEICNAFPKLLKITINSGNPQLPSQLFSQTTSPTSTTPQGSVNDNATTRSGWNTTTTSTTWALSSSCQAIFNHAAHLNNAQYLSFPSRLMQGATAANPSLHSQITTVPQDIANCSLNFDAKSEPEKLLWCTTKYAENQLPYYSDVTIEDTFGHGFILNMTGVQLTFQDSLPFNIGTARDSGRLVVAMPQQDYFFFNLTQWMYIHTFPAQSLLVTSTSVQSFMRLWANVPTTVTTTSSTSVTTTLQVIQVTTSTTSTTVLSSIPDSPPGLIVTFVEEAIDHYLDMMIESFNASAAGAALQGLSFAGRLDRAAQALDVWAASAADATELSSILAGLAPAAALVDLAVARPLETVLQALDSALPSEWNESSDFAGSTFNVSSLDVISSTTTSTSTLYNNSNISFLCRNVQTCVLPSSCDFDPVATLECVAWSTAMERWVAALGCTIEMGLPQDSRTLAEVVCVCEAGSLHGALAVAVKEAALTPRPPRQVITTREYLVAWTTKLNTYNSRGVDISVFFLVAFVLHVIAGCCLEQRWRMRARWVHKLEEHNDEIRMRVQALEQDEKEFKSQKIKQIRETTNIKPEGAQKKHDQRALSPFAGSRGLGRAPPGGILVNYIGALVNSDADDSRPPSGAGTAPPGTPPEFRADARPMRTLSSTPSRSPLPSPIRSPKRMLFGNPPASPAGSPKHGMSSPLNRVTRGLTRSVSDLLKRAVSGLSSTELMEAKTDIDFLWDTGGLERFPRLPKLAGPEHETLMRVNEMVSDFTFLSPGVRRQSEEGNENTIDVSEAPKKDTMLTDPSETPKKKKEYSPKKWLMLACARCAPTNLWQHCLEHHKLFSLKLDTQAFLFSAPERTAILHISLWINAMCLASLLHQWAFSRPGEDTHCAQTGSLTERCFKHKPSFEAMVVSSFITLFLSNILMVVCRGRSFPIRAAHLSEDEIAKALIRQVFAAWPICLRSPGEVCSWTSSVCKIMCHYLCFRSGPAPKPRPPLSWQPSFVPLASALFAFIGVLTLRYCLFFFSSSDYKWEITYSDMPGRVEIVLPPAERPEEEAALNDTSNAKWLVIPTFLRYFGDSQKWLLVPQMQRYLILLLIAWFVHLCILEPLLLLFHLFIGEPTIDETIAFLRYLLEIIAWILQTPLRVLALMLKCILPRRSDSFALIAAAPPDDDFDPNGPLQHADERWVSQSDVKH